MRNISGIKYSPAGHVTLIILIAALSCPFAYSQTEVSNLFNINTPQSNDQLIKQGRGEERRMIENKGFNTSFSVKVTTTNQKRFDSNRDGYLSGPELKEYLAKNCR